MQGIGHLNNVGAATAEKRLPPIVVIVSLDNDAPILECFTRRDQSLDSGRGLGGEADNA